MPYLIDGNNFLGYTAPDNFRDKRSKVRLVYQLLIFQRMKRTKVLLVFDGAPDEKLTDMRFQEKKFSIIYPPLGQNADETIKDIISRQTDLRKFFVVSSDFELKNFAKAKGARPLSSKEFSRELRRALKENRKAAELSKEVSPLTRLELNHWLQIFEKRR